MTERHVVTAALAAAVIAGTLGSTIQQARGASFTTQAAQAAN